MTRSIWKGPFCEIVGITRSSDQIPKKVDVLKQKIWSRRSVILPKFLGKNFFIYNGKSFIPLTVIDDMIGHKFGEFANTRKKAVHKKKILLKKRK